jgi:hypothetical protein
MKPLSPDTTDEAQRKHYDLMRGLPPERRLALAFELTQATRNIIIADLRFRFPKADEEEIRWRFIARILPRKDVVRAYGFDPIENY